LRHPTSIWCTRYGWTNWRHCRQSAAPQLADNPKVTSTQVFDVMAGVAAIGALPDMAKNFLRTVIENGRLSALPEVAEQFRALKNRRKAVRMPPWSTAHFPSTVLRRLEVAAVLEKRFGRKLNLSVEAARTDRWHSRGGG
jgi:F-type H+-transporting ATPase subunit delta